MLALLEKFGLVRLLPNSGAARLSGFDAPNSTPIHFHLKSFAFVAKA